ncbi:MAG TPA: cytochrome c, partial [Methylomirabilota bacterium]|nr:cytochrome c [Methylomirabilota bacterium]
MRIPPALIAATLSGFALIALLVAFQIPSARSATPAAGKAPAAGHPAGQPAPNPQVQRGQQLFAQYCASCHGAQGKGD